MTTENEGRVVTLYVCPECKALRFHLGRCTVCSIRGPECEAVDYVPKQELTQAEERVRVLVHELRIERESHKSDAIFAEHAELERHTERIERISEALDSSTGSR